MTRAEFRFLYRAVRTARQHNDSRAIGRFSGYSLAQASTEMDVAIPADMAGYDFSFRLRRPMIRDERTAARRHVARRIAEARACYQQVLEARAFAAENGIEWFRPEPIHPDELKTKLHAEYRRLYARISA